MELEVYVRTPLAGFVLMSTAISIAFVIPEKANLVGHWTFDESDGVIIADESSYGTNGEIRGNVQRQPGVVGDGCLEFDGSGGFIDFKDG